jgi:uncharacterized LabA/DUF88 family protein
MTTCRIKVYIDYQNVYEGARDAFFDKTAPAPLGQFDPLKFGQRIASKIPARGLALPGDRLLCGVRSYVGRPDSRKQSNTHAAHLRQCDRGEKAGVTVLARMLRYPRNWPSDPAKQKGVDVSLAIDFIAGAIDDEYDIGVIASTDTDLVPALEFVLKRFGSKRVEVAAWHSERSRPRLNVKDMPIWCHFLHRPDYDVVADDTDYNIRRPRSGGCHGRAID